MDEDFASIFTGRGFVDLATGGRMLAGYGWRFYGAGMSFSIVTDTGKLCSVALGS